MHKEAKTYFVLALNGTHAIQLVESGRGFENPINAITCSNGSRGKLYPVVAERKSYIGYDASEVK